MCDMPPFTMKVQSFPAPHSQDVLMTLTCLTLRNYFAKYEPSTLKQSVRANMPISMRKEGDEDACPLSNTLKRGKIELEGRESINFFSCMIKPMPRKLVGMRGVSRSS